MTTRILSILLTATLILPGTGLVLQAQPKPTKPAPDNYLYLRTKYEEFLQRTQKEREIRKHQGKVLYEDLDEKEFELWDLYQRNHFDSASHEPGKLADMSQHLRDFYNQAARSTGKAARSAQSAALICPSAGLGNWTSLGPSTYAAPIMGKVISVYVDPANPNTAYAGTPEGGLFKTVNNGASWTSLTDASHYPALGVTSIAVHPIIPTTLYISTATGSPGSGGPYGFGILKSTDGGTTWQEIFTLATFDNQANYNIGQGSFVSKIMLHPQDPNTIYALASHYVFRSTDAGATWQKVKEIIVPPNPDGCGYRLVDIDILNGSSGVSNSKVIVSTVRTAWMGIPNSPCGPARSFLSILGGANGTFNEITSTVVGGDYTDRIATAVQPGNNTDFFVAYQNMSTNQLTLKKYNTISSAATLVGNDSNGVGAGFWTLELEFSKLNPNRIYVGGLTVYSANLTGGFTLSPLSSYWATDPNTCLPLAQTHGDIRAMMVARNSTNDVVAVGSDGGTHKAVLNPATTYTPTTANWHDMTGPGLAINEFFDLNGMQSNADVLVGGTQDNGTFEYYNGTWRQRLNYDGWQGAINPATGEYFGMSNAFPIKGMTGTSGTFGATSAPAIGGGPVVSDPNNPAVLYGGSASLYKSTNFSSSAWTTMPSPPGTTDIRVIQVAPSNSSVLYVSRDLPTWNPADFSKRLFRSGNGGSTWTDIGVNLTSLPGQSLAWAAVSGIAIDPNDANRIWISLNGYWPTSNTSTNGVNRVLYSGNGGANWSDFTYNLLAFPVTTLVYQRGSDDGLYAGTDIGVFRYNKSLQAWECFNNQLPVIPVTRLEINDCKNKIRAATWGRGVYDSDLPLLSSQVINTSVTWSGIRYLANDLTIAPGATLTLTGTLNMRKDTRIIVQRGATLNVNGGRITNACGDMWFGIELWGTAAAAQNLPGAQGKVIVQNGARIENAVEAITTGKDVNTTLDFAYTGGIIQATDSYFYNNRRSAQFMYYQWMNGPNELSNLSYFRNCTFETNRLLNDPTLLPYAHISLYAVKGVNILGCKFNNTAPASVFGANDRGDGLVSYDGQYTVNNLSGGSAPSVFNGLTYGVRADFSAGANKKIAVWNSNFNNVQRGVQITNSNGSSVRGNSFNALPNALTANFAAATWGVRMNNASSFAVADNTVTGASASYQNDYGVIVDNCGSSPGNQVSRNTLKNLYTGIQALGGNGAGTSGVQFKCNVFQPAMAYQLAVQSGGSLADQGNTCSLGGTVDNTFFAQTLPVGSQINSPGVAFNYFASGTVPSNVAGSVTVTNCSSVAGECSANSNPNFDNH